MQNENDNINLQIQCIKWDETDPIKKADFWIKQGIPDFQVQYPEAGKLLF